MAIMSYNGTVEFGLLADYDAMPDVSDVGAAIRASLDELLDAARDEAGGPSRAPDGAGAPAASRS
jgi:hypothetical protein